MAFVYAEPALAREHILRAAGAPVRRGRRAALVASAERAAACAPRFSDDLAWLPYVVDHYVRVTGDASVLDETVPFLAMRQLEPDEHEVYDLPQRRPTSTAASTSTACARCAGPAPTGAHGLPLIGIGDWNDGMNRVGVEGRGESVWLAWFLIATLRAFARHAEAPRRRAPWRPSSARRRTPTPRAVETARLGRRVVSPRLLRRRHAARLGRERRVPDRLDRPELERHLRRGRSGRARRRRCASLEEHLVREDARLLLLLTPPFDKTPHDPGLHQGLPARRARERRAVHPRRALGRARHRPAGRRRPRLRAVPDDQPAHRTRDARGGRRRTRSSRTSSRPTCTPPRATLGRGGWTWYTGSASWMYRVGLEAILGFTQAGRHAQPSSRACRPRGPSSVSRIAMVVRRTPSWWSGLRPRGRETSRSCLMAACSMGKRFRWWTTGPTHEVVIRPRPREGASEA